MSFYQKHVFICTNQKEAGKKCCQQAGADQVFTYVKQQLQQRNAWGPGKIRVSRSGCLGRCASGPVMVVYPDNVWYRYQSEHDIDAIIEQHLLNHHKVPALELPDEIP